MSVGVIAELFFRPDVVDGVKAGMAVALPETRAFDGCESCILHQDQDDPGHLVLVERWTSRDRYQAYLSWRASQGMTGLMEGATAPLKITYIDPIDV